MNNPRLRITLDKKKELIVKTFSIAAFTFTNKLMQNLISPNGYDAEARVESNQAAAGVFFQGIRVANVAIM